MAASALFDIPVWAALNATMIEKWTPPPDCEEVVIFGDNDPLFGGQAAACRLAHRLAVERFAVAARMPQGTVGRGIEAGPRRPTAAGFAADRSLGGLHQPVFGRRMEVIPGDRHGIDLAA